MNIEVGSNKQLFHSNAQLGGFTRIIACHVGVGSDARAYLNSFRIRTWDDFELERVIVIADVDATRVRTDHTRGIDNPCPQTLVSAARNLLLVEVLAVHGRDKRVIVFEDDAKILLDTVLAIFKDLHQHRSLVGGKLVDLVWVGLRSLDTFLKALIEAWLFQDAE